MVFHKYIKIRLLGDEENKDLLINPEDDIVIEEKIDGASFRFMRKDDNIIYGSRNQSIGDSTVDSIGGNWKRCVILINNLFYNNPHKFLEGYIYYGECCVKHTMDYDWEKIPAFLGFDVFDLKHDQFLPYPEQIFLKMKLGFVPIIKTIKAKDLKTLTDDDVPDSKYASPSAKDLKAEGIVLKNYNTQVMAKYVRAKFKEKNLEVFGGGKKWAVDDDGRIVAMYCTNARIDKAVFKLIDEGFKLELKLMEQLPKRVVEDVYEECWKEICHSSWSVNFRNIRKKITARCLNVLKQMIVNNGLNK